MKHNLLGLVISLICATTFLVLAIYWQRRVYSGMIPLTYENWDCQSSQYVTKLFCHPREPPFCQADNVHNCFAWESNGSAYFWMGAPDEAEITISPNFVSTWFIDVIELGIAKFYLLSNSSQPLEIIVGGQTVYNYSRPFQVTAQTISGPPSISVYLGDRPNSKSITVIAFDEVFITCQARLWPWIASSCFFMLSVTFVCMIVYTKCTRRYQILNSR